MAESMCRVCTKIRMDLLPLNFKKNIHNKNVSLRDIVKQCSSIELEESDCLPQNICKSCMENAENAFIFQIQCQEAAIYFKNIKEKWQHEKNEKHKSFTCHICEKKFKTNAEIEIHGCTQAEKFRILTRECKYAKPLQDIQDSDGENSFSSHEANIVPFLKSESESDEDKQYTCDKCSQAFRTILGLETHLQLHSKQMKKFKCISCQMVFQKRRHLSDHLKTHSEFKCTQCPAKFTFVTNLRKHLKGHVDTKNAYQVKSPTSSHVSADKRTCDICFKVFKFRPSMLKHKRRHNISEKHCQHCNCNFKTSVEMYKHMEQMHHNLKTIVCTECGKRFFKEWNLKMHMAVHSGIKPYMCELCGVSFALAGNLASHKRLHTGEKPYKCTICPKEFTQQAALRSHEAGHSNRKDYVCPDCGRAFSRAGAMRNHRKRHLGMKPFLCNVCGKSFTFSSERKRHMTIHSGEKNHVCEICGRAFNRSTNLSVHKKIHTGETPHVCTFCGKGFIQAHCLKTHISTHVKSEESCLAARISIVHATNSPSLA